MMKINYKKVFDFADYTFVIEDYIPLKVEYSRSAEDVDYYNLSSIDEKSVIEFTFGSKSQKLHRITLLLCDNYEQYEEELIIQEKDEYTLELCETVDSFFSESVMVFKTEIYKNAVKINFSDSNSYIRLRNTNLTIGLDEDRNVCELIIFELTPSVVDHLKTELQYAKS